MSKEDEVTDVTTNPEDTAGRPSEEKKTGGRGKAKAKELSYTADKKRADGREYAPGSYREIEGGLTIVDA